MRIFIKIIIGGLGLIGTLVGLAVAFWPQETVSMKDYLLHHGTPTCSDPKWLIAVPADKIAVNAIYIPRPYFPRLTLDGDPNTAWLQWWPTNDFRHNNPEDNRIHWVLPPPARNLRLICIINGWAQDTQTYNSTEPIRNATLDLRGDHCRYNKIFRKEFTREWQPVKVACKTSDVILYIKSTYPVTGTPHCIDTPAGPSDCRELTGISEIRFYYSPVASLSWDAPINQ